MTSAPTQEKTFASLAEMQAFERELDKKHSGQLITDSSANPNTKEYRLRWQVVTVLTEVKQP